jgi:hypothetical protein
MIFVKISLGIFFIRIVPHQWQRILIKGTVSTTTVFGVVCLLYSIFRCGIPLGGAVGFQRELLGECTSKTTMIAMAYSNGILSMVSDLLFALIPFSIIRQTQMDRRNKIIVYLVLCVGTL